MELISMPASTEGTPRISLQTAIDAHMRWKDALEHYIHGGGDAGLTMDNVAADDQCLLGKWIYGEGRAQFGHLEIFQGLVRAHAEFHCQAATILALMQRGNSTEAMNLLQMGDYPRTSARVKGLLARLYVEVISRQPAS